MARVFAVMVQILLHAGAIAVQVRKMAGKLSLLQKAGKLALAQCRAVPRRSEAKAGVQTVSEPEIYHGAET
jgi:hypothetical protein